MSHPHRPALRRRASAAVLAVALAAGIAPVLPVSPASAEPVLLAASATRLADALAESPPVVPPRSEATGGGSVSFTSRSRWANRGETV